MIFKPISDLVQLDQSKISDSMLLVRSGAENDAKDYKLTISNLVNAIKPSGQNSNILTESNFPENGLTFSNIFCNGIYKSWPLEAAEPYNTETYASVHFSINTPYILDINRSSYTLYIDDLTIRVRSSYGTTVLIHGTTGSVASSYTNISSLDHHIFSQGNVVSAYQDAIVPMDYTIHQDIVVPATPNQIRVRVDLYNNLRYMIRQPATNPQEPNGTSAPSSQRFTDDTICTVTASGTIKLYKKEG